MNPSDFTLDHHCPMCGQRILHLDGLQFFNGGGTSEMFERMLDTLIAAHKPDCKPKRAKLHGKARARRILWWSQKLLVPVTWPIIGLSFALGHPEKVSPWTVAVVYMISAVIVLVDVLGERVAYRRGWIRGRMTAGQPWIIDKNLHVVDDYQTDSQLGIFPRYHRHTPDRPE